MKNEEPAPPSLTHFCLPETSSDIEGLTDASDGLQALHLRPYLALNLVCMFLQHRDFGRACPLVGGTAGPCASPGCRHQ